MGVESAPSPSIVKRMPTLQGVIVPARAFLQGWLPYSTVILAKAPVPPNKKAQKDVERMWNRSFKIQK